MLKIVKASLNHAPEIARLQVDGWQSAFKGIVPQNYLDNMSYEERSERMNNLLSKDSPGFNALVAIEDSGAVVGFSCSGPSRTLVEGFNGELWAIYVNQNRQGQGIGQSLVVKTARSLQGDGLNSMIIWCLADNPYRRFYQKLGGIVVAEKYDPIGGATLKQIAYGWADLKKFWELRW
jgi:ribosomal protein S18 acetylase RimI-like enzyme